MSTESSNPEEARLTPSKVQQCFDAWGTYLVSQHCKACVDWLSDESLKSSRREYSPTEEIFKSYMDAILSGRQPRRIDAEAIAHLLDYDTEELRRVRLFGKSDNA